MLTGGGWGIARFFALIGTAAAALGACALAPVFLTGGPRGVRGRHQPRAPAAVLDAKVAEVV